MVPTVVLGFTVTVAVVPVPEGPPVTGVPHSGVAGVPVVPPEALLVPHTPVVVPPALVEDPPVPPVVPPELVATPPVPLPPVASPGLAPEPHPGVRAAMSSTGPAKR